MLPSAQELRYFLEISRSQNLSKAAKSLGVTQPTLSVCVSRLENELGSTLLIRTPTGVLLTPAGKRFAVQAQALFLEWQKLKEESLSEQTEARGRYTIGCHPAVALYSLPGFLPGLLDLHPGIEIQLRHDLSRKITDAVVGYEIDFGIVVNPIEHPELVIRTLCEDEVTLFQLKGKKSLDVLLCDTALSQTDWLLKQFKKSGTYWKRIVSSSSLEVVAKLASEGAGKAILPTRVAQQFPKLARVEGAPVFKDRICMIYRADAQKSRGAKLIGEAIAKGVR